LHSVAVSYIHILLQAVDQRLGAAYNYENSTLQTKVQET